MWVLSDIHPVTGRVMGWQHVIEKYKGPMLRHLAEGKGRKMGWPSTSSVRGLITVTVGMGLFRQWRSAEHTPTLLPAARLGRGVIG